MQPDGNVIRGICIALLLSLPLYVGLWLILAMF